MEGNDSSSIFLYFLLPNVGSLFLFRTSRHESVSFSQNHHDDQPEGLVAYGKREMWGLLMRVSHSVSAHTIHSLDHCHSSQETRCIVGCMNISVDSHVAQEKAKRRRAGVEELFVCHILINGSPFPAQQELIENIQKQSA